MTARAGLPCPAPGVTTFHESHWRGDGGEAAGGGGSLVWT
jgi:hypothetical protein